MPRKKGSQNTDFAASRRALLVRLRAAVLGDNPPSSYRSLAAAAGVTIPTLRHYFGDREAVFAAVFADCREGGRRELEAAETPTGTFRQSINDLVQHVGDGFRYGRLDRLHAVGLIEGLADTRIAHAYLADVLEPTIQATQRRLEVHMAKGEMRLTTARNAAVVLLGPIVLIYLHQQGLSGALTYLTDIDTFLKEHSDGFVKSYEMT